MGIDSIDWDALCRGGVKTCRSCFEGPGDVLIGDVQPLTCSQKICGEEGFCRCPIMSKMEVASSKCPYRAAHDIAVSLVEDAYPFPPILLVV